MSGVVNPVVDLPALRDDSLRAGGGMLRMQKPPVSHVSLFSRVFPVKLEPPASWVPE